jgi:hypothetical protein
MDAPKRMKETTLSATQMGILLVQARMQLGKSATRGKSARADAHGQRSDHRHGAGRIDEDGHGDV